MGWVWNYGGSRWHKKYLAAKKPLWAPEVHYLKGTVWLTYSLPGWDGTAKTSGSGLLKSTTGKPEGPYGERYEALPHAGHTTFFRDERGQWWCTYFGSDDTAPWRERAGVLAIEFEIRGHLSPKNP